MAWNCVNVPVCYVDAVLVVVMWRCVEAEDLWTVDISCVGMLPVAPLDRCWELHLETLNRKFYALRVKAKLLASNQPPRERWAKLDRRASAVFNESNAHTQHENTKGLWNFSNFSTIKNRKWMKVLIVRFKQRASGLQFVRAGETRLLRFLKRATSVGWGGGDME